MAVRPDKSGGVAISDDAGTGTLWMIAAHEDAARAIERHLRNGGHPLRAEWLSSLDTLEARLRRGEAPDLLLIDRDVPGAPRDRVLSLCRSFAPDLPTLAVGRGYALSAVVAALAAGARDYAGYGDLDQLRHLELVVLRELIGHQRLRELRGTQARLADFETRHQQLTASTGDAVGIVLEGILTGANQAFLELLGYPDAEAIVGQPLVDLVETGQRPAVKDRLRAVLKGRSTDDALTVRLVGRNGPVEVRAQLILGRQDGEQVIELLIRAAPPPPPATSAPAGRSEFLQAIAGPRPPSGCRAALLLHIDAFAAIEEQLGLVEAQTVATRLGQAVASRLKPGDRQFAFSIDEMALLIERDDVEAVDGFAETLRHEVKEQIFSAGEHDTHLTISLAAYPLCADDEAEQVVRLLAAETRSLSEAGGNRRVLLGKAVQESHQAAEHAQRSASLRKALAENRFKLAFQTIASLEGDARSHYDVLLRLIEEGGEEVHASGFMPAAHSAGLMGEIDRWVVGAALEAVRQNDPRQAGTTLFVKLSETTVQTGDVFLAWLRERLAQQPLRADELVFEIPEIALQNHIRKGKALAQGLAALGAAVAIEHFGLGAASAQLLTHIPIQYLKFHASFTQQFKDRETQKRLGALVDIAKQRRIRTIVSHVEDANAMARLWQMGVNFVQGYHIQEPEVVLVGGEGPAAPH